MPVEVKMVALCELYSELQSCIYKLDRNTRVSWSVVGWDFEHAQFAVVEGQLLDCLGFKVNSLSDPD